MGIFDGDQSELQQARRAMGEVLPLSAPRGTDIFYADFLKHAHPDYFVGCAIRKLHEELRAHADPAEAVQRAAEEIRQAEARMLEEIQQRLMEIGNQAMANFEKQVKKIPALNSTDKRAGNLLSRAVDESSAPSERMAAINALKRLTEQSA